MILIIFNLPRTILNSLNFFIATSCLVSIKKSVTLWKTFLGRLTTLVQMAEQWTVYRNKNFSNNAISSPTDSKWKCWNFWWMMFSFRHSLCSPYPQKCINETNPRLQSFAILRKITRTKGPRGTIEYALVGIIEKKTIRRPIDNEFPILCRT